MKIEEIKNTLRAHKGQNLKASWKRVLKVKKSAGNVLIEKRTTVPVRGGIDYDNIKVVKEGREDGSLPEENAGLPWGEWVEFPLHIAHKGQDYIRLYPASGVNISTGKEFIPITEYFFNGVPTSKESIQEFCLASEFPKDDERPLCFTVKAESIENIG
jgi:hypothetical protein